MQPVCYAADDWFSANDTPPLDAALMAVRAAGLGGIAWSLDNEARWDQCPALLAKLEGHRLVLASVSYRPDIRDQAMDTRLEALLSLLAPHGTILDLTPASSSLHDTPSAPRGDRAAAALVTHILAAALPHGVQVSLAPRHAHWLALTQDCVRLGMRLNRQELGATFHLPDWRCTDAQSLDARLDIVIPRLVNVTLDNVDHASAAGLIQRLLVAGYAGPIGLRRPEQSTGDWQADLRVTVKAYVDLVGRVTRAAE